MVRTINWSAGLRVKSKTFFFVLGTMSDDEMRQLGVPALQDDGLIFLWVTGRAMELGRECLKLWGYEVNH